MYMKKKKKDCFFNKGRSISFNRNNILTENKKSKR